MPLICTAIRCYIPNVLHKLIDETNIVYVSMRIDYGDSVY